jgi:hypothetical protein
MFRRPEQKPKIILRAKLYSDLKNSLCSDTRKRIDLDELFGTLFGNNALRKPPFSHHSDRVQNTFSEQNNRSIRHGEMLLALVN